MRADPPPLRILGPGTSGRDTNPPQGCTIGRKTMRQDRELSEQRRRRTGKPKVRTGCLSCKRRHVKCDERKPCCQRCEHVGIACQGYVSAKPLDELQPQKQAQRTLLPRPKLLLSTSTSTTPAPLSPLTRAICSYARVARAWQNTSNDTFPFLASPSLSPQPFPEELDDHDAHYFSFFQLEAVKNLSPHYHSDFWYRVSLHETSSNKCILHSVLAIGAYSRAIESARRDACAQRSPWSSTRRNRHHEAALRYYATALQLLRENLQMRGDARMAMMATLLFIVLENMQGDYHAAGSLIRSGIKILGSSSPMSRSSLCRIPRGDLDGDMLEMTQMFARHSITGLYIPFPHCKTAYHMLLDPRLLSLQKSRFSPRKLPTVELARAAWDFHLPGLANFVQKCVWHNLNGSYDFDAPDASREQAEHLAWLCAFGTSLERLGQAETKSYPQELNKLPSSLRGSTGLELLMLQHAAARLLTENCLDPSEAVYDACTTQFQDIISKVREIISTMSRMTSICDSQRPQRPAFVNDAGVLPILGFVACKCRVSHVRKEALCLIEQCDWREASWDSRSLAAGIRKLMELEQQLSGDTGEQSVPICARFAWTNASWEPLKRMVTLEFTKLLPGVDGDYETTDLSVTL